MILLLGCDDGIDKNMTGYKFTVSNISDLDRDIDQVAVNISYPVKDRITGSIRYENRIIASAPVKNKGFTVYLPEYLPAEYLYESVSSFHIDDRELTITNQNVKITRHISFLGYANSVSKGYFICDNVHSNPLVEKGYNEIGMSYSNTASRISGTQRNIDIGENELRYSFDLDMKVGYNLYMESTEERTSDGKL